MERGGHADKAGVQISDIILSVYGQPVERSADLARHVASNKPGTPLTIEVWRNKQRIPTKVTTAEVPTPGSDKRAHGQQQEGESVGKAGLSVSAMSDEQRRTL